jgi:hypothetical protein
MTLTIGPWIAWLRKGIVALLGLAGTLVALGLIHGQALQITNAGIALATALGVLTVRNGPKPAAAAGYTPPPPETGLA